MKGRFRGMVGPSSHMRKPLNCCQYASTTIVNMTTGPPREYEDVEVMEIPAYVVGAAHEHS